MKRVQIKEISTYYPKRKISNQYIEDKVNNNGTILQSGTLQKVFGSVERRFAAEGEQVSDLASKAAQKIVDKIGSKNIDYLIFAAACADLIEPATSNIIQAKLGLTCPCVDIKNACNSHLTAIEFASGLLLTGKYKNILIVTGEKLSDAIDFNVKNKEDLKSALSSYTLGDGGAATLITLSNDDSGIVLQKFKTVGEHWDLCTIKGGGSLFPRDLSQLFFRGKTAELKDVIAENTRSFFLDNLQRYGWSHNEIDHVITHQVSINTFDTIFNEVELPTSKNISVFKRFGNVAAASVPIALFEGVQSGKIQKGDKIVIIGLAAGISASLQLLIW